VHAASVTNVYPFFVASIIFGEAEQGSTILRLLFSGTGISFVIPRLLRLHFPYSAWVGSFRDGAWGSLERSRALLASYVLCTKRRGHGLDQT
jgi:hypothetical protein